MWILILVYISVGVLLAASSINPHGRNGETSLEQDLILIGVFIYTWPLYVVVFLYSRFIIKLKEEK